MRWNKRLKAFLCPDCRMPIQTDYSQDGSKYKVNADQFFFLNENKKNHKCPECGTPLWAPINGDRKLPWVKIGDYGWVYRGMAKAHLDRTKVEKVWNQINAIAEHPDGCFPTRGACRRFPLSTYIKKKLRGRVDGFLCDELHEYNNASGQGDAMAELFGVSKHVVGMTATLINGYSSGIFHLLYTYGVELDEGRAEEAQKTLYRVGFGSFFYSTVSREAFHLLFLNPPYLSVLNQSGSRSRHEKRFLIESLPALVCGGLLIYVIPYYRLTQDICQILVDNFDGLSVWRFTDAEFKKFKQVAVFGVRKKRERESQDTTRLEKYSYSPGDIPCLTDIEPERYALPGHTLEVKDFRGENFNEKELEVQLRSSGSFAQMMARSELDSGVKRPLLPLSIGQIGLIGGSGMINGLIECEHPHIIKGRIVKVMRTESEEKFSARGQHMGTEVRQTITNKMIFNILTPNGFRALT